MSLDRALEIMRLPIDPTRADLLRLQAGVIQSVFTATVRVDQAKLRGQKGDEFEAMLAAAKQRGQELRERTVPAASARTSV